MELSRGNLKLGNDTLILNMNSATNCPAKFLGLCKLPHKCYALKAEKQYKAVLPYRERQHVAWDKESAADIVAGILLDQKRYKNTIKYLRFSEAGDFMNQADVDKMSEIAQLLEPHGVRVYGYTARRDLCFIEVHRNMVVNGSGFMVHNSFTAESRPAGKLVCPGNCRTCQMCKYNRGISIEVKEH